MRSALTPDPHPLDPITDLARNHSGRVLAVLANKFGDLDLADEAVQEALIRASERFAGPDAEEPPDNPGGWLMTVARRIGIDMIRTRSAEGRRVEAAGHELTRDGRVTRDDRAEASPRSAHARSIEPQEGDMNIDDQLRLVLLCCHPALSQDAQVALTLRLVAGLTTEEIAAAFLVPTATIAQRVTRAKRKIRDAGIPLAIPPDLPDRMAMVRAVLYLTFNEGYLSRSGTAGAMRDELCRTAIGLTRSLHDLMPDDPETLGLLALELFHQARRGARFTDDSELVQLADQDRSTWNRDLIAEGNQVAQQAMAKMQPGPFQVLALIAGCHANATDEVATDWVQIEALYSQLRAMAPSAVVDLNHAVAVAMALGPEEGLACVRAIDGLDDYHLYHSTLAYLLDEVGDAAAAQQSWHRAHELTANPAEQEFLARHLG